MKFRILNLSVKILKIETFQKFRPELVSQKVFEPRDEFETIEIFKPKLRCSKQGLQKVLTDIILLS